MEMKWRILHIICTIVRSCFWKFSQHFYTVSVLTGGHSGQGLEASGKVVDRLKSKTLGNLGEIESSFPSHLPGSFDFHVAEVIHDAVTGLLMEHLLKLAAANHVVPADLGDGERLIQSLFQIGYYT